MRTWFAPAALACAMIAALAGAPASSESVSASRALPAVISAPSTDDRTTGPTEFFWPFQVPAAWDVCKPIRWVVDYTGAGSHVAGAETYITQALADITNMSKGVNSAAPGGYRFVKSNVDGTGLAKPATPDSFPINVGPGTSTPDVDLVFGFATGGDPSIRGTYTYNGLLGPTAAMGGPAITKQESGGRLVSATVLLDVNDLNSVVTSGAYRRALVRHEMGHVMGLKHAKKGNMMFKIVTANDKIGSGDVNGIQTLAAVPCG